MNSARTNEEDEDNKLVGGGRDAAEEESNDPRSLTWLVSFKKISLLNSQPNQHPEIDNFEVIQRADT